MSRLKEPIFNKVTLDVWKRLRKIYSLAEMESIRIVVGRSGDYCPTHPIRTRIIFSIRNGVDLLEEISD